MLSEDGTAGAPMGQVVCSTPSSRHLSAEVCFRPDFVGCTLRYGLSGWRCRWSGGDPQATWALPLEAEHWSLTMLREKLVKIRAKVVRHGRNVTFQMAEVAVPRDLSQGILRRIDGLRRPASAAA